MIIGLDKKFFRTFPTGFAVRMMVKATVPVNEQRAFVEKKREDICLIAMLDTLEYLKRGGRISKTAALAGGILNIKPVITVKEGEILILGKARGAKKANNLLVELAEKNGVDYSLPILLGYAGTSDELLQNYIHDSRKLWEGHVENLEYAQICSVVGTHTGPGAVAAAFFRTNQDAEAE